ncbi:MAG: hypothetical protein WDN31_02375 [Hyphomicrobium sp.]
MLAMIHEQIAPTILGEAGVLKLHDRPRLDEAQPRGHVARQRGEGLAVGPEQHRTKLDARPRHQQVSETLLQTGEGAVFRDDLVVQRGIGCIKWMPQLTRP